MKIILTILLSHSNHQQQSRIFCTAKYSSPEMLGNKISKQHLSNTVLPTINQDIQCLVTTDFQMLLGECFYYEATPAKIGMNYHKKIDQIVVE